MRALYTHSCSVAPDVELDGEALERLYATDRSTPRLRMNFVASVDGAVSVDGLSGGLSGPADKRAFKVLRGWCDGLVVAAGTVLAEDYGPVTLDADRRARRVAAGLAPTPTLVVVSGSLSIGPLHASLAQAPVRPIVVTRPDAPDDRRRALAEVADVLVAGEPGGGVDLAVALDALHERGLSQLLCEGGPQLFAALTAVDRVDEICLTLSPLLAGGGPGRISTGVGTAGARGLTLAHVVEDASVLLLRYCRPSLLH
ncbi:pyrimidine reductase family protein [Cryptosporangium minutisporangium]|uniref:pyrimidine reductase family protein n=1 Tax=Cryptosporangium minutisporangium TaxID=113569 RepID=UPI0031F0F74D